MNNLCSADFFKPTPYNSDTKTQIWMSMIADGHDIICHCNSPFSHLLATIFPPGHQDRDLTINQILQRDFKQGWHSTGGAGESSGGAEGEHHIEKEDIKEEEEQDLPGDEINELLAAAAAADNADTR